MVFESINSGIIILILIGIFALVCIIAFTVYKITHPKLKSEKPTEEQILKEEMERYTKPIEDEEVAKEVSEYKEKDD